MRTLLVAMVLVGCAADGMQGLQGAAGPRGPDGKQGLVGPPGADGADGKDSTSAWRPTALVDCSVALDVVSVTGDVLAATQDGIRETFLAYSVLLYLNGDVEVSCTVGLGTAQEGGESSYMPAPTVGARDRSCLANADYPSPNSSSVGYWRFTATDSMRGEYVDADNPFGLDGRAHVFVASECAARSMDDAGVWSNVALAEALL
jgi:hypothetical protein